MCAMKRLSFLKSSLWQSHIWQKLGLPYQPSQKLKSQQLDYQQFVWLFLGCLSDRSPNCQARCPTLTYIPVGQVSDTLNFFLKSI